MLLSSPLTFQCATIVTAMLYRHADIIMTMDALLRKLKLRTVSIVVVTLYTLGYVPMMKSAHNVVEFPHEVPVPSSELTISTRHVKTGPSVESDGYFNGFELFKVDQSPRTDIHCVGENFQEDRGYMFRSCRFTTFCFDTKLKDFVVYPDKPLNASIYGEVWSATHNPKEYATVVAGSQNKMWWPIFANERDGLKTRIGRYQPKFVYADDGDDDDIPTSYYRFNATWLPFYRHQRSPYNPGHLIWDDFLGLYTLLDIFDQTEDKLMLTHMIRKATEDFEGDEASPDFDVLTKFLPLMGEHTYPLKTLEGEYDLKFKHKSDSRKSRHVICADNGLIGSGMFSDHGDHHWHGHEPSDFQYPHNNGRGGHFRRYRQWMMEHIGVNHNTPMQRDPYLIIVSQASSTKRKRKDIKFEAQIIALKKSIGDRAVIKSVQFAKLPLVKQVELLSRAAIFISAVGGATVTGTFLPKGASVILYHVEKYPLDWDWWNNFPQIKASWIPTNVMDDKFHLEALVQIVQNQLDFLDRQ